MMKKIFTLLIILVVYSLTVLSQTTSGPLNGNETWDTDMSPIHITGDVTVDNETLTIDAGVTIKFDAGTNLIITGTGVLDADGESGNEIIFTEFTTDAGWGHISFQFMGEAGASIIDYCIIEFGDLSGSGVGSVGGGIYVDFSDLTISNSIIRDNEAVWGGGIFVDEDVSPTISNCLIKDNDSDHGGGGIYFWNGAGSVVENCIFDGNRSNETTTSSYTGGGIAGQIGTSIKVLNCTFVNNTSNQTYGQSILLHSSSNARVINSIVWGSGNEIYLLSTNTASIVNCAVEGTGASSYINSIDLDASNSASDGPNFVAEGSDWSIKFISPCRDIGTDTYSGVTIPTTDYDGNNRIGTTDIGTYEVQYSRWKTDASSPTNWTNTGNWEEGFEPDHSGTTGDVAIPALSNDTYAPDIGSITIASGKSVILEPGAKATFGSISNSGTLRLESDADSTSSLIIGGEGVNANVELYLTGGEAGTGNYRWHYISSPFYTTPSITPFTDVTLDLAQFYEALYTSSNQAWIASDGYIYETELGGGTTFSILTSGKGYNFYDNVDNEITISGQLQYDDVEVDLDFGDNGPSYSGFNLLGNPFPSGLDWDDIIDGTYYTYPASTSKGLYFTRDNVQCSYIGGVGTPSDVTGIIPPMQGFFVKKYITSSTITLPAAARVHNSIHSRYKGKSVIPLVRLSILQFVPSVVFGPQLTTNDSLINDETVVRFAEQAKPGLDYDFDAVKMFLSDDKLSIYSYNGETNYAINGQPFPEGNTEIPLAVNIIEGGHHITISAIQLQGLDNYQVTLKDLVTGFDVDLKTADLIFTAPPGTYTNRFLLTISGTTGIEDIPDLPGTFNVFAANNQLNIKTLSDAWNGKNGTVRIFDITGRTVSEIHNKEFWKNSILQVPAPSAKGIYFVEISSGVMRYVGKVSVVR